MNSMTSRWQSGRGEWKSQKPATKSGKYAHVICMYARDYDVYMYMHVYCLGYMYVYMYSMSYSSMQYYGTVRVTVCIYVS